MSKRTRRKQLKEQKPELVQITTKLAALTTAKEIEKATSAGIPFQIVDLEHVPHCSRDLAHSKQFFDALARECSLTSLFIQIHSKSVVEAFCQAMQKNKSIKTLKIPSIWHYVDNEGSPFAEFSHALLPTLLVSQSITTLNLDSAILMDDGCVPFENYLRQDKALRTLSMVRTQIRGQGMKYISEGLKLNTTLTNLNLSGNRFGTEGIKSLGDALVINQTLSTLTLEDLMVSGTNEHEGWIHFFESLKTNTGLTELDLKRNPMHANEWTALDDMLKQNSSLIVLNLSGCNKPNESQDVMSLISEGLKVNKTLVTLLMYGCGVSNRGCKAISDVLSINESIHELDLSLNYISYGCEYISEGLKRNNTITSLNLFLNKSLGCEGTKYIAEALQINRSLTSVNLQDCSVKAKGCEYLGKAIKTNGCLMTLNLTANDIGPDGCNSLIEGLKENTSLTDISITKSKPITSDMLEAIVKTYQRNKIMRKTIITDTITSLINIARRPESFDLFPLEIWLRIFKHFYCSGIPRFSYIANTLFGHAATMELNALLKLRLVRHRGKVDLV